VTAKSGQTGGGSAQALVRRLLDQRVSRWRLRRRARRAWSRARGRATPPAPWPEFRQIHRWFRVRSSPAH